MKLPIVDIDHIIAIKSEMPFDYGNDIFRTASLWITDSNGCFIDAKKNTTKKLTLVNRLKLSAEQ